MQLLSATMVIASLAFTPAPIAGVWVPIEIPWGWGTELENLAVVDPASELARSLPGKEVHLAYKWDQYWIGFPFWVSGHSYLVGVADNGTGRPEYFTLHDQNPEAIAKIARVEPTKLGRPIFSRFPFGYLFVAVIILVVQLISGRSPRKRFERLLRDPRYQRALLMLQASQAGLSTGDVAESPEIAEQRARELWCDAVGLLEQQGVHRTTAERNLRFMLQVFHEGPR